MDAIRKALGGPAPQQYTKFQDQPQTRKELKSTTGTGSSKPDRPGLDKSSDRNNKHRLMVQAREEAIDRVFGENSALSGINRNDPNRQAQREPNAKAAEAVGQAAAIVPKAAEAVGTTAAKTGGSTADISEMAREASRNIISGGGKNKTSLKDVVSKVEDQLGRPLTQVEMKTVKAHSKDEFHIANMRDFNLL